jgi:hypothetical protein
MSTVPACRIVTIHTFRGDRSATHRERFHRALDDERKGRGPGPTVEECLLYAGHTGISTDADQGVIYGFNPRTGNTPIYQVLDVLSNRGAYPGEVRNDTAVFDAAAQRGLTVLRFDIALSPAIFAAFESKLNVERAGSPLTYGFPNGDGDCNCTTWVERLGLPLLTGFMAEFTTVTGVAAQARRRFGVCI